MEKQFTLTGHSPAVDRLIGAPHDTATVENRAQEWVPQAMDRLFRLAKWL